MAGWRERWRTFTSFGICTIVVILGTLLYPLVLLFFSGLAICYPLYRRMVTSRSRSRSGLSGGEARE